MLTRGINGSDVKCGGELVSQLLTNCGTSSISESGSSSIESAVNRLTTFLDSDGASPNTYIIKSEEDFDDPIPLTRISFDMLGICGMSEKMLRELYEAFDVRQKGGVERCVMREMLRSGFSNYGAPCTNKDIKRIFERITPFAIRRKLDNVEVDGIMSFDEFCAFFMAWLRQ